MACVSIALYAPGEKSALNAEWDSPLLIDVQDPILNLVLNTCFLVIILLTVIALVPWKAVGADRVSRGLRWLAIPVFILAVAYERAMPSRFDIRVDLLLLLPAYALVLVTSVARWLAWRRKPKA